MRVAIVGAGIHGLSAARSCAGRGHEVEVFEMHPLGHSRGSSHGKSRIVRRAYPDAFYTQCMAEAYPMWRELEAASGEDLMHEVGLVYFGNRDAPNIVALIQSLQSLKVPHEVCDRASIVNRMPQLRLQNDEIAVFSPDAGWVRANAVMQATFDLAASAGCKLRQRRVSLHDLDDFDFRLICAGPWVKSFWPQAPVEVRLQGFSYFKGESPGPVWIEESEDLIYGFPDDDGLIKIAYHRPGPEIDPDSEDRTPTGDILRKIADVASNRLGLPHPVATETMGCVYTFAPNEDFMFKKLDDRTWLVSACSGHGFKFGPWIGVQMADLADGNPYPRHLRRLLSD